MMKKYKPTSPVPFWMKKHRGEFDKIAKKVPKNELEELKELKDKDKVLVILTVENGEKAILAVVGHHTFKEWNTFFEDPNNGIKCLTYTQGRNADEKPMEKPEWKSGNHKEPFYFFEEDDCYLLLALMLSDAFKVIFALTKHSGGDAHRSVGMTDYLLYLIGEDAKKELKQQGKNLLTAKSKGESLESVKLEIDKIVNKAIFKKDSLSEEKMYDLLKQRLLTDIPDPIDEEDEDHKRKEDDWAYWIAKGFDGFNGQSLLLEFYLPVSISEKQQQDWEVLRKILQNRNPDEQISCLICKKMREDIRLNYEERPENQQE